MTRASAGSEDSISRAASRSLPRRREPRSRLRPTVAQSLRRRDWAASAWHGRRPRPGANPTIGRDGHTVRPATPASARAAGVDARSRVAPTHRRQHQVRGRGRRNTSIDGRARPACAPLSSISRCGSCRRNPIAPRSPPGARPMRRGRNSATAMRCRTDHPATTPTRSPARRQGSCLVGGGEFLEQRRHRRDRGNGDRRVGERGANRAHGGQRHYRIAEPVGSAIREFIDVASRPQARLCGSSPPLGCLVRLGRRRLRSVGGRGRKHAANLLALGHVAPPPMHPEPQVRIPAHVHLQDVGTSLCELPDRVLVVGPAAARPDARRPAGTVRPARAVRRPGRPARRSEAQPPRARTWWRRAIEEIDVDGVRGLHVLVDQERDAMVRLERAQDATDRARGDRSPCCRFRADRFQQAVEQGLSSGRARTAIGAAVSAWTSAWSSQKPKCPVKHEDAAAVCVGLDHPDLHRRTRRAPACWREASC